MRKEMCTVIFIMYASIKSEYNVTKWKWFVFIILLGGWNMVACTRYLDSGEMVRHHFGYVKVITPAVHAPETAVRVLDIETYGIWSYWDTRSQGLVVYLTTCSVSSLAFAFSSLS